MDDKICLYVRIIAVLPRTRTLSVLPDLSKRTRKTVELNSACKEETKGWRKDSRILGI